MNRDKLHQLVTECLNLSQKSYMHFKHGAIIVRNGRPVAYGFNSDKHHAEHSAILNLSRLLCEKGGRKDR